MKRFVILCACTFFLLYVFGCRKENAAVKVTETAGISSKPFPKFLAGTWLTAAPDTPGWQIVLSPEGTVSSVITRYAGIEIRPNQTTEIEMVDGSKGTFKAGDCPVDYDPVTRELSVIIYVEKFSFQIQDVIDEGYIKDIFSGKVSDDGKSWVPDWMEFFDYGPGLEQAPEETYLGTLPFKKISDWKEEEVKSNPSTRSGSQSEK